MNVSEEVKQYLKENLKLVVSASEGSSVTGSHESDNIKVNVKLKLDDEVIAEDSDKFSITSGHRSSVL